MQRKIALKRNKDQKKLKRLEHRNAAQIIKDSESELDTDADEPAEAED